MTTKHTPGPWDVVTYDIERRPHWNGEGSAIMYKGEKIADALIRPTAGERKANARLIAAAPLLLEAVKALSVEPMTKEASELGQRALELAEEEGE